VKNTKRWIKYWQKKETCLIAAGLILGFLQTESPAQMTEVSMGVAFVNARVAPLWVAEKEGFFKKNGINIKTLKIAGGTQGAQAMLSGGVDIGYTDPTSTVSAIAAGAQLVEIMAITTIMPYYLVGSREVKSVADLKGKRVGSSGLGLSASRLALMVALNKMGLEPKHDQITLVAAGAEPERIAGLAAGALGGTVVGPEFRGKIEQLNLNILADLRTLKIPWEQDALVTSRKYLEGKQDTVERLMKGLLQANAYVLNPANRAAVTELLKTQLGMKSAQEAEGAYEDLTRFYVLKKPYPYREGLHTIIAEVGKEVPKAASLKFEDVADPSIIQKLDKSGFIDGLYK
jgi:ABC-type nitrate/sulfonate/bicarbonate transport system substrate-binding protein